MAGCSQREQQQRRWQGKTHESRQRPAPTGAQQPYAEAELTACRPGEELTQPQQVSESFLIQPAAPFDKFATKVPYMRDGTAKGRNAEFQKGRADFKCGAPASCIGIS
jgi:hypothetical protein